MKQFNVRDDTHKLGRELSHITNKSIIEVVGEALIVYSNRLRESSDENMLVDRFLNEATGEIVEKMRNVMHEKLDEIVQQAVEKAATELLRLQEEVRVEQAKELEQTIRETLPEAPEDDLEAKSYEELYGSSNPIEELDGGTVE